ncbi:MAG: NAD(P)H-dependent oxidoreductase subunit E [Bacillota bacterium]
MGREKRCLCNGCQADSGRLNENNEFRVTKIIQKHRDKPDALLQVLFELHNLMGYVTEEIVYQIADGLEIPPMDVYSMITYYPAFRSAPAGKHKISVCLGTSCYLRGSSLILDHFCRELQIEPGETTADGRFTLEVVRCIGACALGPVVMVNEDVHPGVEPAKISDILKIYD